MPRDFQVYEVRNGNFIYIMTVLAKSEEEALAQVRRVFRDGHQREFVCQVNLEV